MAISVDRTQLLNFRLLLDRVKHNGVVDHFEMTLTLDPGHTSVQLGGKITTFKGMSITYRFDPADDVAGRKLQRAAVLQALMKAFLEQLPDEL